MSTKISNRPLDEEFEENPEPRCPFGLMVDTSGSVYSVLPELNGGLKELETDIKKDSLASKRCEVSVITFGGKAQILDPRQAKPTPIPVDANRAFSTVDEFRAPKLSADGSTPLGEAVRLWLNIYPQRRKIYRDNDVSCYKGMIFCFTDGEPNDPGWEDAAKELRELEAVGEVHIFMAGTENANFQKLALFSDARQPLKIKDGNLIQYFKWISDSLSQVSSSTPDDVLSKGVQLAPLGWANLPPGVR